jgi:5-methylcytosine-specific restriction enzyme subunit McrC
MTANTITVYEHQPLRLGAIFTSSHLKKMAEFYGEGDCPYYTLINEGVKFKEYVGVIQVGDLTIEILPKTDKYSKKEDEEKWRSVLIDMLRKSGILKVSAPTSANLSIRRNHILDLYFELFLSEIERLLHEGLIKKYRKTESNLSTLKGKLNFSKHIAHNLVHQEHLYCEYTTYDVHHNINQILFKTLKLLSRINTSPSLYSRVGNLLLNFPEMDDLKVSETTFRKINFDRKNLRYKDALDISELLLLNYHPDVKSGRRHLLALMFDMNRLWEKYVFRQLYPSN